MHLVESFKQEAAQFRGGEVNVRAEAVDETAV